MNLFNKYRFDEQSLTLNTIYQSLFYYLENQSRELKWNKPSYELKVMPIPNRINDCSNEWKMAFMASDKYTIKINDVISPLNYDFVLDLPNKRTYSTNNQFPLQTSLNENYLTNFPTIADPIEISEQFFITPQGEKQINLELNNKFYPFKFVDKLYLTEDEDILYIDIILSTSSYTNKQLKKLLETELSIRKDFGKIYFDFTYFNRQTYFIRNSSSILLFEKNG